MKTPLQQAIHGAAILVKKSWDLTLFAIVGGK